jgi:hypothetical protein
MPMLLLRPVLFAALFFIIVNAVQILISRFLPELLEDNNDVSSVLPGSRVNITEGDTSGFNIAQGSGGTPRDGEMPPDESDTSMVEGDSGAAIPKPAFLGAQADDSEEGLGDISDLISNASYQAGGARIGQMGIDQNTQDGYNDKKETNSFPGLNSGGSSVSGMSSMPPPKAAGVSRTTAGGAETDDVFGSAEILPDLDSMAGAFRDTYIG